MKNISLKFAQEARKKTYAKIGKQMREIRGSLTQAQFGEILGIKQQQYYRYETGQRLPPTQVLQKIADYGKIKIDQLLTSESTRYPVKKSESLELAEPRQGYRSKISVSREKMERIYREGDKKKIKALEAILETYDPKEGKRKG